MGFRLDFVTFPVLAVVAGAAACSSAPQAPGTGASSNPNSNVTGNSQSNPNGTASPGSGEGGVDAPDASGSGLTHPGNGMTPGPGSAGGADGGLGAQPPGGCPVTGFAGDSMCLAPPAATDGFQLHYGPQKYDSASEQPFLLQPNAEVTDCFYEKTSNTSDRYISGFDFQMRPGSHHIIMNVNSSAQADGFAACGPNDQTPGLLFASEVPVYNLAADPAPENAGLAVHVPANSQAVVNFHVINTSAKPLMREAWLNYFYIDPSKVTGIRGNVFLAGGLQWQIAPGTHKSYDYSCNPTRRTRVLSLAAHMHAHALRMTMWKVSGGTKTQIYESYSWENPAGFNFDSVHKNPAWDAATKVPGAVSGQLILEPTDSLAWECEVNNDGPDTLTFTNQVYKGEMCIVGGTMVPADDPMKPYDFSCGRP